MFSTTDSSSTLRIGLYLFYIEKIITQFKTTEKNDRSPYSFSRKWWFTSMARFSHKENAAIFNARELMMREIMRSRDAQCNTGEWTKVIPLEVPQFKSSNDWWCFFVYYMSIPSSSINGSGQCTSLPFQMKVQIQIMKMKKGSLCNWADGPLSNFSKHCISQFIEERSTCSCCTI